MFIANREQNLSLFAGAKETLNPQACRGFVDAFLVRQQSMEVRRLFSIQSDLRLSGSSVIRSRSNMGLLEPIPTLLMRDGPPRILLV